MDGFKNSISFLMPEYNANKVVVHVVAFVKPQNVEKQNKEIDDVFVCVIEETLEKTASMIPKLY